MRHFSLNDMTRTSLSVMIELLVDRKRRLALSFVHLHTHTEYSLLDGSNKIKEYVARVKELGMNSAAITDHGVMFGVIDFYRAAKEAGINPIIGCEVYVAPVPDSIGKWAAEKTAITIWFCWLKTRRVMTI